MIAAYVEPQQLIDLTLPAWASSNAVLVDEGDLRVFRLVIPRGREVLAARFPGTTTLQCLTGRAHYAGAGKVRELVPGQMMFLAGSGTHSFAALEDTVLLVTAANADHRKVADADGFIA